MDVRMFTVGPVAENSYIFRRGDSDRALIVDPGDEAEKLIGAIDGLGVKLDGILLTRALRPRGRGGAGGPGHWCRGLEVPEAEAFVLADINSFVPWPGFGPFEVVRGRARAQGRRAPEAGRFRDRRALHRPATVPAT